MDDLSGARTAGPIFATLGAPAEIEETWYGRVVRRAFRNGLARWAGRRAEVRERVNAAGALGHARRVIRRASIKSATAGAMAGTVTTAAAVATAEAPWGVIAAVPAIGGAILAETLYGAVLHVDLACQLAEIYGVPFDPRDEDELLRLQALVFGTCGRDCVDGRGRRLVERVTRLRRDQAGEALGRRLLGDAVLRDLLPFVDILVSSIGNYLATRDFGNTMRRFMRYERGMRDALDRAKVEWSACLDLLVEGMWFIFAADGIVSPEEAAMLAHMLRDMPPAAQRELMARFVEDERGWIARLPGRVPEGAREAFLHALEVAAALDKKVGLPERRILSLVAESFGRVWDAAHVEQLVAELPTTGVANQ